MMEHVQAQTIHVRRGVLRRAFRYGVDFLLVDADNTTETRLLSVNRFNLWSLHDRHHGGPRGAGSGVAWFRDLLGARGFDPARFRLMLLAQPSFLWFQFNPVSFWIAIDGASVVAFVAEVNSTFGQRHCYFCARPDHGPITGAVRLSAEKLMHVSPFQTVAGTYRFRFSLTDDAVDIRISYENGTEGLFATLAGPRRPVSDRGLLWAAIRRPFGAARVVALIHWQALRLWLRRAPFTGGQPAPDRLVSGGEPMAPAE